MAKWADYGISRVRYNANNTAIDEVEVMPDLGDSFGAPKYVSRAQVVVALAQGLSFVTLYLSGSLYHKGENLHVVTVYGVKYLRTTPNAVKGDNLGELPTYDIRRTA